MLHRRELSAYVIALLDGPNHKAGLVQAPEGAAWDGQPNKTDSAFRPYLVVTPMSSGPGTGAIDPAGISGKDWQMPYSVASFGVTPEQTEYVADIVREIFTMIAKTSIPLGDESYKVQQVRIDSIGAIQRVDAADPPYWGQSDSFTVWLAKERA